jgi:hypothetical protein
VPRRSGIVSNECPCEVVRTSMSRADSFDEYTRVLTLLHVAISGHLGGLKNGETTKDGKFTLIEVECLGACSNAPSKSSALERLATKPSATISRILHASDADMAPRFRTHSDPDQRRLLRGLDSGDDDQDSRRARPRGDPQAGSPEQQEDERKRSGNDHVSVLVVILSCLVLSGQMFVEVTNDVADHRLLGGLQLDERSLWTRGALSARVPVDGARETFDACLFVPNDDLNASGANIGTSAVLVGPLDSFSISLIWLVSFCSDCTMLASEARDGSEQAYGEERWPAGDGSYRAAQAGLIKRSRSVDEMCSWK